MKCPNFERGCSWQGDLGDVEEHTKGTCISQEVACSKGCGSKMLRLAVPDHFRKTMASGSLPRFSYRGVTYAFVDTPLQSLEDLKCPICLELVSDPVQTSCGHLFCGECIKGIKQCPYDREDFTSTPDHFNRRRLRSFKVKCPNFERGCSWQGDLGDSEKHTKATCISQEVECSKGCGSKMLRLAVPDHFRKTCPLRDYRCPHCQLQGTYDSIVIFLYANGIYPTCA